MSKFSGDESTSADCEEDRGPSRVSEELPNPSSEIQYFPVFGMIFGQKSLSCFSSHT